MRNNYLDAYFFYRGIGAKHEKASEMAKKECILFKKWN